MKQQVFDRDFKADHHDNKPGSYTARRCREFAAWINGLCADNPSSNASRHKQIALTQFWDVKCHINNLAYEMENEGEVMVMDGSGSFVTAAVAPPPDDGVVGDTCVVLQGGTVHAVYRKVAHDEWQKLIYRRA